MAREVSYAQQTHDSPNPFTRLAHRSRYKISLDLSDRLLPQGGTLVDFGAGEGTFLHQFGQRRTDANLLAIEPYLTIAYPNITRAEKIWDVPEASVDVLGTFEVLEHVTDDELADFLAGARRILKPGGKLLVTVPIMYGLTLPVKELSRSILHRRLGDTGPIEIAKATAGMRIARTPNRRGSHKGFDFRWLREEISKRFDIAEQRYSPFANVPWWANSQAIFIAQ